MALKTILVTGGAGFIGGNFIHHIIHDYNVRVVNLDALTYAGNLHTLAPIAQRDNYKFVQGSITDAALLRNLFAEQRPNFVVHFAAESHVDRSIEAPNIFIQTNVSGTNTLLECAREYWGELTGDARASFRFLHVSTDEVYGSLGSEEPPFTEDTAYAPNSPYAASKASSDHFVRSSHKTYSLPVLITHCSNNYGPFQFPEKLIPLCIHKALKSEALPIYGDGSNIRDWLHVDDHCRAINLVLEKGQPGEVYNIGGDSERTNLQVIDTLCELLDELAPNSPYRPHASLKTFVSDRPGHDHRYAIDATKLKTELGWQPLESFETGLRKTVQWYLHNTAWVQQAIAGRYSGQRLGQIK